MPPTESVRNLFETKSLTSDNRFVFMLSFEQDGGKKEQIVNSLEMLVLIISIFWNFRSNLPNNLI